MTFSNTDKLKHGQNAQNSLESILLLSKKSGYLTNIKKNFRTGKAEFSNKSQFHAPFLIEFKDSTKWALFSTTSMRNDRLKGQQWDAVNLKSLDQSITKVYLIYPDACSEEKLFVNKNKKYETNYEYSAIDGIISQNEISNRIEEYAIKDKNPGKIKHIQGNSFEHRIAEILKSKENLKKWKISDPTLEGIHYGIFQDIVHCFNLNPNTTSSIYATSDKSEIGLLPSKGKPKTDVIVKVEDYNGHKHFFTISCKRSSDDRVSVHEYTANDFADVLNKDDSELRTLLFGFQKAGSMKKFGKNNCELLEKKIKPYLKKLTFWVLGGIGGSGNSLQCAKYILTYDNSNDTIRIHTIENYYELLTSNEIHGNFGTPFSWTYPSKKRGKSIQLKCKIIK